MHLRRVMSSFKYVAFEGIDGAGKSTQARMLYDYLKARHESVYLTREPGGTMSSLREILLHKQLTARARLFLFLADRAQNIENVITKLQSGHVITDRSLFSTIAYQAFGYGLDLDFVERASIFSAHDRLPDITFILDIDYNTMLMRTNSHDAIESEGEEFYERVREGYRYIATNFANVHMINANKSKEEIFEEIEEIWIGTDSTYML